MPLPEMFVETVARTLNERASDHEIGRLQDIRTRISGLRRATRAIFDSRTIFDDYAFHVGGRHELQFNIGIDGETADTFRYGVAFSLQPGRNLPSIEPLLPKIVRFNEFLRLYPDRYADLDMWYWNDNRSPDLPVMPIRQDWVVPGKFIFLGKRQQIDAIDYDAILSLFDRLLPLYEYTQGGQAAQPIETPVTAELAWRTGLPRRRDWTSASIAQKELDIDLRHNALQSALYKELADRYGEDNVFAEASNGSGGKMDVVVRFSDGIWIYEIKTGMSARGCIREAIGQLLEYSLWPGSPIAAKLIVIGEAPLDSSGDAYLARLNTRFPLPISYEQVVIPN